MSYEFFNSHAWQKLRMQAIGRYGEICLCCGDRGSPGNPTQVDHVKPRSRYPELELDPDNLQVLCRDCNMAKGTAETDYRPTLLAIGYARLWSDVLARSQWL